METTGQRIRQARLAAGLTQTELADKIGVKHPAIHKYETGAISNLKRETIGALAKALNVRPSWLMCMEDDNEKSAPSEKDALVTEIAAVFSRLSPGKKQQLLAYARLLAQQPEEP